MAVQPGQARECALHHAAIAQRVCKAHITRADHHKLIAAKAIGAGAGSQAVLKSRGHQAQNLVAHGVAQGVVDELEVVQIKGHHRQPRPGHGASFNRFLQVGHGGMAVEQAGHAVLVGQLVQGLGDLLHVFAQTTGV